MKIGIITQQLKNNYGGLLQNFALQTVLKQYGHEPKTMNHINKKISPLRLFIHKTKKRILHFLFPDKYDKPCAFVNAEQEKIIRRYTKEFVNKYISTTKTIDTEDGFYEIAMEEKFQAFIVGSDQCWRPKYSPYFSAMFLSFVRNRNDIKRISYATSIGVDRWDMSNSESKYYAELAKLFNLVTVREASAIDICKKYLNVNAIQVLDPTMLLKKEDYIELINKEKEEQSQGDLFYYILDPTIEKQAFISRIEKEMGLKAFKVLPKYKEEYCTKEHLTKHIEDCVYPPVTKWLRGFYDAKMVVIDSFHGAVFSILFNKPFWVIGNKYRGNTRFDSLLSTFSLQDRFLKTDELTSVDIQKNIDWNYINEILDKKRIFSKELLIKTLNS